MISLRRRAPLGRMERRERRAFYFFLSPWIFGLIALLAFPLLWGLVISLFDYSGMNINNLQFEGLANFRRALQDPGFWHGMGRTLYLAAIAVPLRIVLGFALAAAMARVTKGVGAFRTIFYLPVLVPAVASVHIWGALFHPTAGLINQLMDFLGFAGRTNWMLEYPSELLVLLFAWGLGETVVIFFAALQGVPDSFTEAASIDGASQFGILRRIVLPLVSPIIFFQVMVNLVRGFQLLTPALLLVPTQQGGLEGGVKLAQVPEQNRLVLIHIYEHAFRRANFSYALAMSWIFFLFIVTFTLINWQASRLWVYYEVDVEAK